MGLYSWKPLLAKAESAKCLSHMRSLQVSLAAYVQDVGHWPQEPRVDEEDYDVDAPWWMNEMKPYGATPTVWMCPAIARAQLNIPEAERWPIHYIPTIFGPEPRAAYKFARQPWLVEAGGPHGRGPHICFPDGSIRSLDDLLPAQ